MFLIYGYSSIIENIEGCLCQMAWLGLAGAQLYFSKIFCSPIIPTIGAHEEVSKFGYRGWLTTRI
jgi:hypothetical protein